MKITYSKDNKMSLKYQNKLLHKYHHYQNKETDNIALISTETKKFCY